MFPRRWRRSHRDGVTLIQSPETLLINMLFIFMKEIFGIISANRPPTGRTGSARARKHVNSPRNGADYESTNDFANEIFD